MTIALRGEADDPESTPHRAGIVPAVEVVAAIAPEVDRLVWAVRDRVRARRTEMPASATLSASAFNPLINLMSFPDQLSESFIRRRYTYRPDPALGAFFAELEDGGYLVRSGDRLVLTDRMEPIAGEIGSAIAEAGRGLWIAHRPQVEAASAMARRVMEAGPPGWPPADSAPRV